MLFLRIYSDDSNDQSLNIPSNKYAQFTDINSVPFDFDKNADCCSVDTS